MEQPLKVLMISSDRNILQEGSAVSLRMKEYGALVGELHIVLMSDAKHGLKEGQVGPNVWAYPTNSATSFLRPLDAAALGKKLVREKGFVRGASLVTADSIEAGWAGRAVKKRWRLPLEFQFHTDPFSPYFTGFQNRVRKFFARRILAAADGVRVVSEELKGRVAPATQAPVAVLPIYVDKERVENAPVSFDVHARYPGRFIILAASRLTAEKDVGTAIRALALLRQRSPEAGLLIAGSGPEEGKLKALAKKHGVEGAVSFAGWQSDMASFYKTSNAFIQTSLFEGYGLSLVEAGLSGLPVVSTPVGVARELREGVDILLCPPQRPDLFAEALSGLVEHNAKRESLRAALKQALEQKLISKEKYVERVAAEWGKIAHFAA
jgi:glycosyltransferase involved in cell wall biosynthesis